MQVRTRWVPPWHVLAGVALLAVSLLHYLSVPAGVPGLEYLKYVGLGAVALCLPRIALRALLALRQGVSWPAGTAAFPPLFQPGCSTAPAGWEGLEAGWLAGWLAGVQL